jgi:Tfp pilus assembly protein PilX
LPDFEDLCLRALAALRDNEKDIVNENEWPLSRDAKMTKTEAS